MVGSDVFVVYLTHIRTELCYNPRILLTRGSETQRYGAYDTTLDGTVHLTTVISPRSSTVGELCC